jgi:hypothetical protein
VHALTLRRHEHPVQPRSLTGEIAEDVDGPPHLAARLGQRLALLARHVFRELLEPAVQNLSDIEQVVAARRGRRSAPGRERPGGSFGRSRDIPGGALREQAYNLVRVRRIAILECGPAYPFAIDVITEDHVSLLHFARSDSGPGLA